jgi:hypothetical protein
MPNRIIREGMLDSEKINSVSDATQMFFVRLMLVVDDFGRMDARCELLRAKCYPVSDKRVTDVRQMSAELVKAGLITLYRHENKEYLYINNFGQRTRIMRSKYPEPSHDMQMSAECGQTSDICQTDVGLNPIQSNPNQSESKPKGTKAPSVFVVPTLEEVKAYCLERRNGIDAEAFIAFYTSKGWKIGSQSMKDWKSAIITWEKRRRSEGASPSAVPERPKVQKAKPLDVPANDPKELERVSAEARAKFDEIRNKPKEPVQSTVFEFSYSKWQAEEGLLNFLTKKLNLTLPDLQRLSEEYDMEYIKQKARIVLERFGEITNHAEYFNQLLQLNESNPTPPNPEVEKRSELARIEQQWREKIEALLRSGGEIKQEDFMRLPAERRNELEYDETVFLRTKEWIYYDPNFRVLEQGVNQ